MSKRKGLFAQEPFNVDWREGVREGEYVCLQADKSIIFFF
jgi:hypothetical protein